MEELSVIFKRKKSFRNIIQFLSKLYYSEKLVELFSFLVWEINYRVSYYSKNTLKFTSEDSLLTINDCDSLEGLITEKFLISPCHYNWYLVYIDGSQNIWGCTFEQKAVLNLLSPDEKLIATFQFEHDINGLFIDSLNNVFCCSHGILFKGSEHVDFKRVLTFSTTESRFRKDAFTEDSNQRLFIGEYANIVEGKRWKFVGYIYYSVDGGDSWSRTDFLKTVGVNKHVHILKWSKLIDGLVMTDGDNQKNIWVNKSDCYDKRFSDTSKTGWKKVNKNHLQKGGYTAIAESNDMLLLGTDYNGGTNFLAVTSNMLDFKFRVIPNPYRRAPFDRILVRLNAKNELEIWSSIVFWNSKSAKSLLMVSYDHGLTWRKVIEYDGSQLNLKLISMSNRITKKIYLILEDRNGLKAKAMRIHSLG